MTTKTRERTTDELEQENEATVHHDPKDADKAAKEKEKDEKKAAKAKDAEPTTDKADGVPVHLFDGEPLKGLEPGDLWAPKSNPGAASAVPSDPGDLEDLYRRRVLARPEGHEETGELPKGRAVSE